MEYRKMLEIDKKLEPEVNLTMEAMEKSFEKYGDIYHYNEFMED